MYHHWIFPKEEETYLEDRMAQMVAAQLGAQMLSFPAGINLSKKRDDAVDSSVFLSPKNYLAYLFNGASLIINGGDS